MPSQLLIDILSMRNVRLHRKMISVCDFVHENGTASQHARMIRASKVNFKRLKFFSQLIASSVSVVGVHVQYTR